MKNLKFEEGLDKQLDTYWGKSTSEEAKIVYKFNCNFILFYSKFEYLII